MWDRLRRLVPTLKLRIALAAGILVLFGVWTSTMLTLGIVETDARARLVDDQQDAAQRTAHHLAERVRDRRDPIVALARGLPPDVSRHPQQALRILGVEPLPPRSFRSTFIASPDGAVVALLHDGELYAQPATITDRDYFQELVATRRGVMSRPVLSRSDGQPSIVMVEPVLDDRGRLQSIVGATLELDGSNGLGALAARVNATTRTVIIDRNLGIIVGHDDPKRLLEPVDSDRELAPVIARLGKKVRGDDLLGADRFDTLTVGWAAVADTPWTVFEIGDNEDLIGAMRHSQSVALRANVLVSAVGAVLMMLVTVGIFRPMTMLHERAVKVLTEPADVDSGWPEGRDEVGELSRVLRHVLRERAAAEAGSIRMLSQLQAVMDSASVAIAFSRDDRFELVSQSMTKLTGYGRGELFGKPIRLLQVSDNAWSKLKELVEATGGRFDVEFPIRCKDRSKVWVRVAGSPVDADKPEAGMVWVLEDATEKRRLHEQLTWSATRDPLTELLNRREFEARLTAHLRDPVRPEAAVLILDLDRFKAVNDTGGHAAGDRLLCELARLIEQQVRRSDYVARLGGDEFAVLLVGCPHDIAIGIAERIRAAVHDYRLTHDGAVYSVGASVGVVGIDPSFVELAAVLKAADEACYAAKRAGRDAVKVWDTATATH